MNHGGPSCLHKTRRYLCDLCNGRGICIHKRQKQHCKDCGTMVYCEHKKSRNHCFICAPYLWASSILRSARKSAKQRRYEPPNISVDDLVSLYYEAEICWLCGGSLDLTSPHLHHDHKTGQVHGFTHQLCNQAEGMLTRLTQKEREHFIRIVFSAPEMEGQ